MARRVASRSLATRFLPNGTSRMLRGNALAKIDEKGRLKLSRKAALAEEAGGERPSAG